VNLAGDVAGLKAQSSLVTPWTPSCGVERGQIKNAISMKFELSQKLTDYFYSIGCNFTNRKTLMTQRLFLTKQSKVNTVHVRNVINHVKKQSEKLLRDFTFEENTYAVRYNASYRVKEFLESIQLHNGIRGGKVTASEGSNNSIVIDVLIYPLGVIEHIKLRYTK